EVAFVVEIYRFARMSEEHSMTVVALRLYSFDREILFCDGVRDPTLGRTVIGVNFLTQHHTFERTTGLPLLRSQDLCGQHRIVKQVVPGPNLKRSVVLRGAK